ncbi:hypothetical protein AMK68_00515 [candidate division KD3-62 bacterium DG_56]|uniref:Uncharacterized protein n=1 Tax=candidate division KD3-62 bacterium DG_56 TaxID=1704032 RepID=A0A0S7XR37_9BACT|nr:MAG: hypothetical protein AMK68_00515 [candidate division KD3-62 bacterium DG_56]
MVANRFFARAMASGGPARMSVVTGETSAPAPPPTPAVVVPRPPPPTAMGPLNHEVLPPRVLGSITMGVIVLGPNITWMSGTSMATFS